MLAKPCAIAALALLALVFVWRGGAAASGDAACAPASGFVPQFCVTVPSGLATRRETTIALASVANASADLRVEAGIPATEVLRVATALDRSSAQVERVFGRPFSERPRVLLFASPASFATGVQELFDYSPESAKTAAASYAGVVDQRTLTVAVDFRAAGGDLASLLAHELVHVMIREIVGPDASLPAWFEEGFATAIQREDALPTDVDALVGRSLVANRVVSLDQLATLADWHRTYARVGRPQYAVAAEAVRAMEGRVGEQGLVRALVAVGEGAPFGDAYASQGGGTLASFMTEFAAELTQHAGVAIGATRSATGDVGWTLFAFAPDAPAVVRITSERGYAVTFTVTTDGLGMFRGSFGSTAPAGSYTIEAASGALRASAIATTR